VWKLYAEGDWQQFLGVDTCGGTGRGAPRDELQERRDDLHHSGAPSGALKEGEVREGYSTAIAILLEVRMRENPEGPVW
jgi:hypothetical protein